jgi:LmbE family N-acetylglucosaminyl deacetylase
MVREHADLLARGAAMSPGRLAPSKHPSVAPDAPTVLIFSPHPDDECIIGGLPLRLLREQGLNVITVAVTQGSRKERRAERWRELQAACGYLGFGLIPTVENGLEHINRDGRQGRPDVWAAAVEVIAAILAAHEPKIIFLPHDRDWNRTHIGVHHLLMDALAQMPPAFACHVVETEFRGAMDAPNLMVASCVDDVADLVAALALHAGEVARNPYHLRLPAWLIDNVRRGSELVMGQGAAAPDFTFATLYRLRRWTGGRLEQVLARGRPVACGDDLRTLFA